VSRHLGASRRQIFEAIESLSPNRRALKFGALPGAMTA
jgi:hypothetical protein